MNLVQLRKLSYDEVAKCNKCGFCLPNCPVYLVEGKESSAPRGRNAITRAVIEGGLEWSPEIERSIFSCLGCGACTAACFPKVQTKDLVFRDRECLVNEGLYPKIADRVAKFLEEQHTISDDDNQERAEWTEMLRDLPEGALEKAKAEVVYFVGCVASFFPLAQKIPVNMARIMTKADVDFAILGGEEWCCGFPFIGMGTPDKLQTLLQHNVEKIEALGAKTVVFTCPSCYHTWKHLYQMPGVELKHSTQMLYDLVKDRRIKLKELNVTVTYHDPCDLGRNSGVFEEPRQVLQSIPGLKLVEMACNRQLSMCCGGGGNVEMVNPELSAKVAEMKLRAIADTKADMVVSSCQQCLRTIATKARRDKVNLVVKDLTELVFEAMG
jgi:heterodisulfide reductase subunit D